MEKLKAGTLINLDLNLKIHLNQDSYFSKQTISEYIEAMVKYYFTGDPKIIYKYLKQDYILDHNI